MERNTLEKLAVAMLLIVFVFALGNLIYNIEVLDIGDENFPEFVKEGDLQSGGVATSGALADAIRWLYYGFLGVCGLAIIVGAISFTRSRDREKWRKLLFQILSVLLAIGVIFAVGYFYRDIESSFGGGPRELPDERGTITSGDGMEESPAPPSSLGVVLTFGLFAIIVMVCIMVLISVNNFIRMRATKLDYSDIERDKQEITQTIQRTIDALAGGSDTRATVIRCYTDMCKVMAKYGVKEEEHLTPREFQKLALDNLPVPEGQMGALVDIFEEARYSQHPLGEADSRRAVAALEAVRGKLQVVKPPSARHGGEQSGS